MEDFHNIDEAAIVIEVERVLGHVSRSNPDWIPGWRFIHGGISDYEVGFKRRATDAQVQVEVHHCFEFPAAQVPPFTIASLCSEMERREIEALQWSRFDRPGFYSFRSTMFTGDLFSDKQAREHLLKLIDFLTACGLPSDNVWVVAEEVLGIWQTPLEPCQPG